VFGKIKPAKINIEYGIDNSYLKQYITFIKKNCTSIIFREGELMNRLLTKCPVCSGDLLVTRLYCPQCDTSVEGHFITTANPFSPLTDEQINFVLTFVRCEGRFNRMEEELNLSYPTLRNRLYEIIRALGYEPGKEEQPARLTNDERMAILDEVAQGTISLAEAQRKLLGRKDDPAEKSPEKS